jgi:hypothetical protein
MDFDRAEYLRVSVSPLDGASKPEATPYPAIEGDIHTPNGFVCAQLNFPTMPQWFNNDILAGPAGSRGLVRYGQRIDAAYRMMDHTKDLMAALSDEKQARYLDAKAQLMETEKFGFHWPPMSLYAHTLVHQGFEEAIQDQPSAEISRPSPPSTLNDQMRGALIFRSALGTPDWQPEKLHTWLTFAATGPGALHHTAMQLTGARFPLADDFKNNEGIAKRFSVRLIELFNPPARGSWHNPQKPTSFDD